MAIFNKTAITDGSRRSRCSCGVVYLEVDTIHNESPHLKSASSKIPGWLLSLSRLLLLL